MNKRISKKKTHMLYNNERKFMYRFTHSLLPAYNEQTANKYMKLLLKKMYAAKTFTNDELREVYDYTRLALCKGWITAIPLDMNKEIKEGELNEV